MDDYSARSRYSRHSLKTKRRGKNAKEGGKLLDGIMRQLIIAIMILVVIGIFKSVNTPVTTFVNEKVKGILFQDIDVNNIYSGIDNFISNSVAEVNSNSKQGSQSTTVAPTKVSVISVSGESSEGFTLESAPLQSQQSVKNAITEIKAKYTFITPVVGTISSTYGDRTSPIKKVITFHKGIDIETTVVEPIKAAIGGKIQEASTNTNYGNCIKISSADGILTTYAHCSQLLVIKSQEVKAGDIIAKVGIKSVSSGESHLHFEISKNNIALDPMNFFNISA